MLKKRITRIIAGILSCLFVGIFMSGCIRIVIDNRNKMGYPEFPAEEIKNEMNYMNDINNIYCNLWVIGMMWLRNIDDKGNFKGTEALKKQTIAELQNLGCSINDEGNISIDDEYDYEYYVSYGKKSFSNTDKNYNDFINGNYSDFVLTRKNDNINFSHLVHMNYSQSNFNTYDTNYGMHYYYLDGTGIALFDYDMEGLDIDTDENSVTIYEEDTDTPLFKQYFDIYEEISIEESYYNDFMNQ